MTDERSKRRHSMSPTEPGGMFAWPYQQRSFVELSLEPPAEIAFDGIVVALVGELAGPGNTERGV